MKITISNMYDNDFFISEYTKENLISQLSESSSLDFNLEKGSNQIIATCDNLLNFTGMLTYRQQYIGV